jgi:pilus assembly protein Flp/PilA
MPLTEAAASGRGEEDGERPAHAFGGKRGSCGVINMRNLQESIVRFIREEEGLTVVEYAIAGGLVGLAVVGAFTNLGTAVADRIQELIDAIS